MLILGVVPDNPFKLKSIYSKHTSTKMIKITKKLYTVNDRKTKLYLYKMGPQI